MEEKYIVEPDGRARLAVLTICKHCKNEYWHKKRFLRNENFCSRQCSARSRSSKNRVELSCANCGKGFERAINKLENSRHKIFFCCRRCKDTAQRIGGIKEIQPDHYKNGECSYREKALREFGNICELCGWSHTVDVHHIDSNRRNNTSSNLIVLCPNCHSITQTNRYKPERSIALLIEERIRIRISERKYGGSSGTAILTCNENV